MIVGITIIIMIMIRNSNIMMIITINYYYGGCSDYILVCVIP